MELLWLIAGWAGAGLLCDLLMWVTFIAVLDHMDFPHVIWAIPTALASFFGAIFAGAWFVFGPLSYFFG